MSHEIADASPAEQGAYLQAAMLAHSQVKKVCIRDISFSRTAQYTFMYLLSNINPFKAAIKRIVLVGII